MLIFSLTKADVHKECISDIFSLLLLFLNLTKGGKLFYQNIKKLGKTKDFKTKNKNKTILFTCIIYYFRT